MNKQAITHIQIWGLRPRSASGRRLACIGRLPLPRPLRRLPLVLAPFALVAAALVGATAGLAASETASGGDDPVVATAAQVEGDSRRTRFRLALDSVPDVNVFAAADPHRIIIDLADVVFALAKTAGREPQGLVSAFRFVRIAPGKARIVIDLAQPAAVDRFFHTPPSASGSGELVVELVPVDAARCRAAVRGGGAASGLGRDPDAGPETLDVPDGSRPVIVLDPGHGGVDPGAEGGSGVEEKTITLQFAKELRAALEAGGRFDVRLTREDDRFVALAERVKLAHAFGADLFISIHADAAPQPYVRGASVYTMSERPSDAAAAALAIRQNLADAAAGLDATPPPDDVADILVELARRETRGFSTFFADLLIETLDGSVRLIRNPRRSARFWVLRVHDIPSVLLEIGYLSNADDERLLQDPAWRAKAVAAVREAATVFFAQQQATSEPR
jgi:N-acetylmuramoyl-L-alanine amidase